MGEGKAVEVENFSHVCVGVSDMDTALAFYTDVLGMDVVFDVNLDGEGLESVTGTSGAHGRMVGGLIGGTMVELCLLYTSRHLHLRHLTGRSRRDQLDRLRRPA